MGDNIISKIPLIFIFIFIVCAHNLKEQDKRIKSVSTKNQLSCFYFHNMCKMVTTTPPPKRTTTPSPMMNLLEEPQDASTKSTRDDKKDNAIFFWQKERKRQGLWEKTPASKLLMWRQLTAALKKLGGYNDLTEKPPAIVIPPKPKAKVVKVKVAVVEESALSLFTSGAILAACALF